MMAQKNRVTAVTGGSRGIGWAVAKLFQSRGHPVAICSRSSVSVSLSPDVAYFQADVRRREEMHRFVAAVLERFGALDILVNSAGVSRWRPVEDIEEGFVQEVMETNLLGTLWACSAAAKVMQADGCIINISSLAGKRGSANNSAYCAAKFAVNGITQALAKELGPRGIRVNAVCPVYVETDRILSALAEPGSPAEGQSVNAYLRSFTMTQTALGRLPTAAEVAEVVYFLASPAASAITGQCVNVDCGTLPQ